MLNAVFATVACLAAGLTQVAAQDSVSCSSCVQSAPFSLVLESKNSSINGVALTSCHSGAAIESLCLLNGTSSTYYFNGSSYTPTAGYPATGLLTWTLQGSNFNESEPMNFYINPASNVALPLFEPGYDSQQVAFTTNTTGGYLAVPSYFNDTVVPAKNLNGTLLQRWYVCQTYFEGYQYQTLAWVLGLSKPQNPSCQKVKVKRVFL